VTQPPGLAAADRVDVADQRLSMRINPGELGERLVESIGNRGGRGKQRRGAVPGFRFG
jgi:hypothetical protein